MSKQRPDADKLANELAGASAFFRPQPTPTPANPPAPIGPLPTTTPDESSPSDVVTSRRRDVTHPSSPHSSSTTSSERLDINAPTTTRDSMRLSLAETKALDQLRSSLRWDHDLSVSKNDIYRAALHMLLDDWTTRGDKSAALSRLKRKQANR